MFHNNYKFEDNNYINIAKVPLFYSNKHSITDKVSTSMTTTAS